jgi:diguanylate cyclase (GGDEF)-like protein
MNINSLRMEIIMMLIALAVIFLLIICLIKSEINKKIVNNKYHHTLNVNALLIEITKQINEFENIDDLYQKLLESTIKLVKGAEWGSILIYNHEKNYMDFKALKGYNMNLLKDVHIMKEDLFLYKINKLEKPAIIIEPMEYNRDVFNEIDLQKLNEADAFICKSCISAPLYVDGEFLGCINVDSIKSYDAFSNKDIDIIEFIVTHLEIAIKNSMLVNEMKQLLITDSLTGLYNRRYYSKYKGLIPEGTIFIMIDMDNFKIINDTYGHIFGDEVLIYFSEVMRSKFRKTDLKIRQSGDEFLIILSQCSEKEALVMVKNMEKELFNNSYKGINIRFSYGIGISKEGLSAEDVKTIADKNMYSQKVNKKERVVRN